MKSKRLLALICSLFCMALLSSCVGLSRSYQHKKGGEAVKEQVKVGDDIYETAARLREAGWYLTGPSFMDHAETRLWAYVKVGKTHPFTITGEATGLPVPHGTSKYVIIKASPDGRITSVEQD